MCSQPSWTNIGNTLVERHHTVRQKSQSIAERSLHSHRPDYLHFPFPAGIAGNNDLMSFDLALYERVFSV
jgi:hypothetical protein